MAKYQVRFEQYFAAPRQKVFAFFARHENLGKVMGLPARRIRDATDPRQVDGLGSVRVVGRSFMKFEETITRFEPPALIEYQVTRGGPIRNHLGRQVFSEADGGTKMVYTIEFDPKIPFTGGLIARVLSSAWRRGAPRAVREIAGA